MRWSDCVYLGSVAPPTTTTVWPEIGLQEVIPAVQFKQ